LKPVRRPAIFSRGVASRRVVPEGARIFQRIFTRLGLNGRPPQFDVRFHPYAALTHTVRLREDVLHVKLSDGIESAPLDVFEAVAAILLARLYRRKPPRNFLARYRQFASAAGTRRRMSTLRRRRVRHRPHRAGEYHNLSVLFAELNHRYFAGALQPPRLGWSERAWLAQLGCFDPALNSILINRTLDRADVPEYVVAYVLYHEMLHMKHPLRVARCRLQVHPPGFRAQEKLFPAYEDAMKFLNNLPRL
jgi:hypothetical protein